MKFVLVFVMFGAFALAKPLNEQTVAVSQDTAGNYKVNVNVEGIQKIEQRFADGSVSGSYSYIDSNGQTQTIQYTAGRDGYRVIGGSDLPAGPVETNLPVQDTPDVVQAKAEHAQAHAEQLAKLAELSLPEASE